MAADILNTSSALVLVSLNSGTEHYLAPGERLRGVERAEIDGNAQLGRLLTKRAIALAEGESSGGDTRDMSRDEALKHIRTAPRSELERFLRTEERVSVRRAIEKRLARLD